MNFGCTNIIFARLWIDKIAKPIIGHHYSFPQKHFHVKALKDLLLCQIRCLNVILKCLFPSANWYRLKHISIMQKQNFLIKEKIFLNFYIIATIIAFTRLNNIIIISPPAINNSILLPLRTISCIMISILFLILYRLNNAMH